ncbi:putative Lysophospholipid acyltransferase [Blattamonas nauphoetae]|uniref:Lysophospholipid acyltransferase n=1 Tax=Blattamonas nauphoetae TaxID=2049346 RepID=A0ABQ9X6Q7_9EUKA|nr:putative Lysophospholipid acyltransferase [Blattamonas nauphoetae]
MEYVHKFNEFVASISDPSQALIDKQISIVQKYVPLDVMLLKSIFYYVVMFLFSFFWNIKLPPLIKHISSFLTGIVLLFVSGGLFALISAFFMIIGTYLILLTNFGVKQPSSVLWFNLAVLLLVKYHVRLTTYGTWQFDYTAQLMILVQTLTILAYNLHDGQIPDKPTTDSKPPSKSMLALLARRQKFALPSLPPILNYLSYTIFPVTFMFGPAIEYTQWIESLNPNRQYAGKRWRNALKEFIIGVLCVSVFLVPNALSIDFLTPEYVQSTPLWKRLLKMHIVGEAYRTKYYSCWCLTTACMYISGCGFDGQDWDSGICIKPFALETSTKPQHFIAEWNRGTQRFLKYYVYQRTPISLNRNFRQLLTFCLSALWHGWYIGYSFTFFSFFIVNLIGNNVNDIKKNIHYDERIKSNHKIIHWVVTFFEWVMTQFCFNYSSISHMAIVGSKVIYTFSALNWAGHKVFFVLLAITSIISQLTKAKPSEKTS